MKDINFYKDLGGYGNMKNLVRISYSKNRNSSNFPKNKKSLLNRTSPENIFEYLKYFIEEVKDENNESDHLEGFFTKDSQRYWREPIQMILHISPIYGKLKYDFQERPFLVFMGKIKEVTLKYGKPKELRKLLLGPHISQINLYSEKLSEETIKRLHKFG